MSCWVIKHSLTNKHLKDEDSNRPPVTFSPIITVSSLGFQHLGRDVVRGSNSCITVDHASLQRNRTQESASFKTVMRLFRTSTQEWFTWSNSAGLWDSREQKPKSQSLNWQIWTQGEQLFSCFYGYDMRSKLFLANFITNTRSDNPQSPFSCRFRSQPAWGVHFCPAACCLVWRLDGWSPWSEWHPGPSPPRPCRTWPISPGHHRCSWGWPDHLLACTPLPCRDSARLGRHSTAECITQTGDGIRCDGSSYHYRWAVTSTITCTTQGLLAKAIMSLSSQKKAESERFIISNLLRSFMA